MAGGAGVKAGKAFIIVEALDKTGAILNRIAGKVDKFGKSISAMGGKMVRMGAVGLAPFVVGAKIFLNFDDSMRRVEARSAGTADEMQALRMQAKDLGRTTSFTASQVGELQAKLAQKGFDRDAIKGVTSDILNLAKAAGSGGEGDASLAADLVSGTLRAYQMDISEAAHLTDLFTATVNGSNFSLEDLSTAMAVAAPNAKMFGVSVEDTLATLASMTNLNIDASTAATSFRNIMLRMTDAKLGGQFNKDLERLTGQTVAFGDAAGNLRAPQEVLFDIGEAVKNLGTVAKGDLLGKLLGKRAITGGGALVDGINAFKDFRATLDDVDGQAKATADTMEGGLGGAFRKFLSALEGVGIAIGESIAPALVKFVALVGPILVQIAQWIADNGTLIAAVAGLLVGLVALGAGGIVLGFIISGLSTIFGLLAIALKVVIFLISALFSPVGLIVVALVAAVAAVIFFSDTVRQQLTKVLEFATDVFADITSTFTTAWAGIKDAMAAGDLALAAKIGWQGVKVVWLTIFNSLLNAWAKLWAGVRKIQVDAINFLAQGMSLLWTGIQVVWMLGISSLKTALLDLISFIATNFNRFISPLLKIAQDLLDLTGQGKKGQVIQDLRFGIRDIAKGTDGAQAANRNKTNNELLRLGQESLDIEKSLNDDAKRQKDAIDKEAAAMIGGRNEALEKEKQLLNDLRQKAEDAAAAANKVDEEVIGKVANLPDKVAAAAPKAALDDTPRKTIQALEKGSAAAVEKFMENLQRAPLEQLIDVNQQQLKKLEEIEDNLDFSGFANAEVA